VHGFFNEPITEPLKFKMAHLRYRKNCEIVISLRKITRVWCNLVHNNSIGSR